MVLQISGVIKLSNMHNEFNTPYKLSAMSNVVAGIPTSGNPLGRIKFSDLYGKAASTPTVSTNPTTQTLSTALTGGGRRHFRCFGVFCNRYIWSTVYI